MGTTIRTPAQGMYSLTIPNTPDMTMEQLHLNNTLDDGTSWDHAGRFRDICVCHAIYSLTSDNLFSYPDILRMNDFRCEVKVTHQFWQIQKEADVQLLSIVYTEMTNFALCHGYKLEGDELLAIIWHMGAGCITDPKEKSECEQAKKGSALVRLIIKADHEAAIH